MGLAITQQIVSQHGGTIDVLSEVGKGTTFTLVFPLIRPLSPDPSNNNIPSPRNEAMEFNQ